jgi:hypothetical protein
VAVFGAVLAGLAIIALAAVLLSNAGSSDSGPSTTKANAGQKRHPGQKVEAKASASNASAGGDESAGHGVSSSPPAGVVPLEAFQGRLYHAEVPAAWTPETIEDHPSTYYESHWRNPEEENTSVLIDSQVHTASSNAVEDAEGVRGETAKTPGYRELAFEETALQGRQAVRWVFEVEEDRRVDYFVISCGIGFGILGSSSPSAFGRWAPTFHAVANSVTGSCE